MKLEFLGTRGEIEARTSYHRRHSSLLVSYHRRRVMVDCGADWNRDVWRIGPHAIVLTHAHPDHAFGLRGGAPCPVWATADCWRTLPAYSDLDRLTLRPRRRARVEGIGFEAFTVEHSIHAPAVGFRIDAGRVTVFYVPDLAYIHQRAAALRDIRLYIGDGASLTRPLIRRRAGRLIGHTPVSTQLAWCGREHVPWALFTHCGTGIVESPHALMSRAVKELGVRHNVRADIACDGLKLVLR
jgi:phosphoribosyl 1,2-cyclic phosphodiesterase